MVLEAQIWVLSLLSLQCYPQGEAQVIGPERKSLSTTLCGCQHYIEDMDVVMDDIISEVRRCLELKLYLAALALALMIPDMCGAIENSGKQMKSYDRYVVWFDKWVASKYVRFIGRNEKDKICFEKESPYFFTGDACYALRCAFLHEGSSDFKRKTFDRGDPEVADYQFRLVLGGSDGYGCSEYRYGRLKVNKTYNATINIAGLCENICCGAEKFYETRRNLNSTKRRSVYVDLKDVLRHSHIP